jgi:di/tricarboxylate transporter
VLFGTEWLPAELTALLLLLALHFGGLLEADEMFAGFGSDVVLFLGSLFVVSRALVRTGALDRLELTLSRYAERWPRLVLLQLVLGTAVISAFLSNTATVAAMLPVASGLARRLSLSPSKLFMPLAFASILGGSLTLIGTSTNIVVSGSLPRFGQPELTLFELTPAALPAVLAGLLFLLTIGRRLLPDREGTVEALYKFREYVSEVVVPPGSPWVGKTLRELRAGADLEIIVLGRVGPDRQVEPVAPDSPLAADEHLLVKANQQALLRLKTRRELDLVVDREAGAQQGRLPVHEVVLGHGSRLSRRTLRESGFGSRYGAMVLALYRRGEPLVERIANISLRDGDVLLVQGDLARLEWLLRGGDLILLEETAVPPPGPRAWLATGLFLAMILVGGAGLMPFPVAALTAAVLLVLSGCLSTREAYEAIDWRILVLVASLLGLAVAMESGGAAQFLAGKLAEATTDLGPMALLAGFYLLTVVLTQPMSNQAAALVVLPVALLTAQNLGLNPRTFAIAITLAASCSFVAPLEPASMLVYGPGRYRFSDYFRVGLPLTLIVFAVNLVMVPRIWPLRLPAEPPPAAAPTSAPESTAGR